MIFDKKRFSELLNKAKGDRSINNFGRISQVDPGYISRLLRCQNDTPPSAAIISKLGSKAHNNVSDIDLMIAAGYIEDGNDVNHIGDKLEESALSKERTEYVLRELVNKYNIDLTDPRTVETLEDLIKIVHRKTQE
ncbi:hypothetical protein [Paenibacillus tianjinensis]|uniref:XRE family transcriptional regulator n=1 Tax=Paenibacillus tianjinensis TaxID=2810347 RepID=A0ABX7L659_9BACL|nr:hypothetical protein [Paenibacillus tianjinensis]QSF42706.1 hypothetical protein JRJ22_15430 [Paenibacillus tianjinensis]